MARVVAGCKALMESQLSPPGPGGRQIADLQLEGRGTTLRAVTGSQNKLFYALLGLTACVFAFLIGFVFWVVPVAQEQAGGLAQKIFYFHVPSAYALYLCGIACCLGSAAYLFKPSDARD